MYSSTIMVQVTYILNVIHVVTACFDHPAYTHFCLLGDLILLILGGVLLIVIRCLYICSVLYCMHGGFQETQTYYWPVILLICYSDACYSC